jgi:hypothetical protein
MALVGIPEYLAHGAIGARAGEDNADGFVFLVLGERAEKIINRQPQQPGFIRLHDVQGAVQDG